MPTAPVSFPASISENSRPSKKSSRSTNSTRKPVTAAARSRSRSAASTTPPARPASPPPPRLLPPLLALLTHQRPLLTYLPLPPRHPFHRRSLFRLREKTKSNVSPAGTKKSKRHNLSSCRFRRAPGLPESPLGTTLARQTG